MTRDQYFEMCELLGEDPVEENIPVEYEDFPVEVQQALSVYNLLRDEWDTFNGIYLGKSLIGITEILNLSQVPQEDQQFLVVVVKLIDRIRQKETNKKHEKPAQ
jgi:hypothetical protein